MISMTIKGDAEVKALLKQVAASARDSAPVFRALGQRVRGETLANFRSGGVFPQKWDASQRVKKQGGTTLVDKAVLRNSIHAGSGRDYASVGTDVRYAAIHQLGGDIRIPARGQLTVKGRFATVGRALKKGLRKKAGMRVLGEHVVHIPARPFLPVDASGNLSPATTRFAIDLLTKHLLRGVA